MPRGLGGALADAAPLKFMPPFVLYISCGDAVGRGKVYQVDDNGHVMGIVNLPYTATGIALHRDHNLLLALPRDGGRIMKIDDTGTLSTVLQKQETVVHPVDVAVPAESDTLVLADNVADVLMASSVGGQTPALYKRLAAQKWGEQHLSIAVGKDKAVLLGTDGDAGIYRFTGDAAGDSPLLPKSGGVAADTKSLRWAATQMPDKVYVFEGQELMKTLRLPAGKVIFGRGLLSFAPADCVVVACRDGDDPAAAPWLIMYNVEDGAIRSLFPWEREPMVDFVVGPRMLWEKNKRHEFNSPY